MDPLTALGLVGNVLTFIDFSAKLLTKTAAIYNGTRASGRNPKEANAEVPTGRARLEAELQDFIFVTRTIVPTSKSKKKAHSTTTCEIDPEALDNNIRYLIAHSKALEYSSKQPGQAESSVQGIAAACDNVANQMLQRLEGLKETAKGKIWPSLKLAVRDLWQESELKDMERILDAHQRNLTLLLVASLRESIDLLSNRQDDQWNASKQSMRDTIKEVIREYMVGKEESPALPASSVTFQTPPAALATLATETRNYMEEQQKAATKEVINAVHHALEVRNLKPLELSVLGQSSSTVISNAADELSSTLFSQEKDIMFSLEFKAMETREDDISEVKAAFGWIFEDPKPEDLPWDNFSKWLPSDEALYWITGKAGSGKSTLMKYLHRDLRVQDALSRWAGSVPLVVASFFFWRSGTPEQKTQEGLLRSLLYQILHKHRELIPILFFDTELPEYGLSGEFWTNMQLRRHFDRLRRQKTVPLKIVLFIDGLDEYDGGNTDIADLVRDFSEAENFRVCASSRPLRDFELSFRKVPSLMLQNLTFNDIKTYVTNKFNEDDHVTQLQKSEPGLANRFASEIVDKANGVFLWVKLAVRSILKGLKYDDSIAELDKRLSELPDDLMELYLHMLKDVDSSYQDQGAKFLQIVYRAHKPVTILHLAFADMLINDPETTSATKLPRYCMEKQEEMCIRMEGRLKVTCLGLLEVTPAYSDTFTGITTRPVQFMHQSVVEFLEEDVAKKHMREVLGGQLFSPSFILMKVNILTVKHLDSNLFPIREPYTYLAETWYKPAWVAIRSFMSYAATEEAKHGNAHVQLIEQMDSEAARLAELCLQRECNSEMPKNLHWSERRRDEGPFISAQKNGGIISFALESGLYLYVQTTLGSGNSLQRGRKLTTKQAKYALDVEEAASRHRQVSMELRKTVRDEIGKAGRLRIQGFARIFGSRRAGESQNTTRAFSELRRFEDRANEYSALSTRLDGGQILSQNAFPEIDGN